MINNRTDLKETKMHYDCQFLVVVLGARHLVVSGVSWRLFANTNVGRPALRTETRQINDDDDDGIVTEDLLQILQAWTKHYLEEKWAANYRWTEFFWDSCFLVWQKFANWRSKQDWAWRPIYLWSWKFHERWSAFNLHRKSGGRRYVKASLPLRCSRTLPSPLFP